VRRHLSRDTATPDPGPTVRLSLRLYLFIITIIIIIAAFLALAIVPGPCISKPIPLSEPQGRSLVVEKVKLKREG
jgi:hypothetical protein